MFFILVPQTAYFADGVGGAERIDFFFSKERHEVRQFFVG